MKFLSLRDQINLMQVNADFRHIVTQYWLIKYKHFHINFFEQPLTNEEFRKFLEIMHAAIETMNLRLFSKEKFEILKLFSYEKVKNLRITNRRPLFIEDEDLKVLHKLYPNLTTFSPHGNFSGVNMDLWPNMKELNLNYCTKLDVHHFNRLMKTLKLEVLKLNVFPNDKQYEQLDLQHANVDALKYLELNTYELYYFLSEPLPSLKELIITNRYNPRQIFDVLLSIWKPQQIQKLECANVDNIIANCLEMNMNVAELCIINDENCLPHNAITSLHLLEDLQRLRFKNCKFKLQDFQLLLKNIPQIQELSLENCQFDSLRLPISIMDVVSNRKRKLRLNFYQNLWEDNSEKPVWLKEVRKCSRMSNNIML